MVLRILKKEKVGILYYSKMKQFLSFAKEIAKGAGKILLEEFSKPCVVDIIDDNHKGIITNADILSDKYIRKAITSTFPEHSIISEESKPKKEKHKEKYEWVIDPLDGTNNFNRGIPDFTISIALRRNKQVQLGVVYAPIYDKMYFASSGYGAFQEQDGDIIPIHVSDEISRKMCTFSFAAGIDFNNPEISDQIVSGIRRSELFRNFRRRMLESTAYELCCVAYGSFDAHFNNFAQPWDIAAGEIIVKEAGGQFSYLLQENQKVQIILASNGVFHCELEDIIKNIIN